MNIDDQNEKNDFLKSDGTGTENKTSSQNERHATYSSTDSMYDDPKKNTIVSQIKKLYEVTQTYI